MRVQRVAAIQFRGDAAIQRCLRWAVVPSMLLFAVMFAACGSITPALPSTPGGTYTNTAYQFIITYPSGWQPNEINVPLGSPQATPSASVAIPLTVVVTQTGTDQIDSALISSFTVTVLNASNPSIASAIAAQKAAASGPSPSLKTLTLAGQAAWEIDPQTKPLPDSDQSATHTDYFLLHGKYEYQLSTDVIVGGGADAALAAMLKSFAFTA